VVLLLAGVSMGLANPNLTDLALGLGSSDRRVTTGVFNLVRWGAAAPAPVVAGLLAEHASLAAPFWVATAVLGAGVLTFFTTAYKLAAGMGERWLPAPVKEPVVELVSVS
jgi:MFS transporter, ACDE family, multidrug resistance protein